jgi:methylated-DNA-[protein]-cysteine S-methyltransferase
MQLARAFIKTPLGEMLALASDEGLCALEFTGPRIPKSEVRSQKPEAGPKVRFQSSDVATGDRLTRLDARLSRWFPPHEIVDGDPRVIARTRKWLASYFAGMSPAAPDIPLDMRGADFEKRVWAALRAIPPGQTTSYGAIAKSLGDAGASRAVGAANGANPVAIIVPCHRVIGSTGSLTGYGGGLERKQWLLDHERRWRQDTLF